MTSTFGEIKKQAQSRWQAIWNDTTPVILVGTATCGRAAGALEVLQAIKETLKRQNLNCFIYEVGCMGHCYAEPLVILRKPGFSPVCYGRVNPVLAENLINNFILNDDPCLEFVLGALEENELIPSFSDFPRSKYEKRILLKNCGEINPEEIEHYIANGGYEGLSRALQTRPEEIVAEVKRSQLRGLGGAGFPAGEKWDVCRRSDGGPKYLICNGDEGDPGAFMDRAILESNPHSVIEGMVIAGYAIGARHGYIYVRAEYPLAVKRVQDALYQAEKFKFLGENILGSDFNFDIKLFQGSGAFVCGEATALIASIEGKPGIPRHRPPRVAVQGLFGKPTVLNNVKTIAYVPHILKNGADWFLQMGTGKSKGTVVFALAGKVVNTGLVEVPMGTTLRQLIFQAGGGIPKGKRFKAVQIGGPSGGCLPESALDLPIDFDSLQESGAMMGSGGMVVLDEDDCMVEVARYFLDFTQKESCGKCTLCRLGTKQMLDILEEITQGRGKMEDLQTLEDLAQDIKQGSLCGLGRTAPNPVLTTLRYFREEYEAHIKEGRCPARMCQALIAYYILPEKCARGCDACVGTCTVEAISTDKKKRIKVIDQEKCVKCNTCLVACPPQYDAVVRLSPPDQIPKENSSPTSTLPQQGGGDL
ncbi:MAG TPA: NADH-ubiquinone oxidoreductase-F iron-sulfur binding region domain-containing protein [Thermodesulfobacteriota bacterium]|nr:NADH-ubiquinone oxidoreductase-F iron-sulfur binding region domain-containing protein [Thermodesulfobacteriota bacterium]